MNVIEFGYSSCMESNESIVIPPLWINWNEIFNYLTGKSGDIIQFLVFSSIFMGMQGWGLVYVAAFIQGVECSPACIVITFLFGFSIYNLNRKTDEKEDVVNHQDRYRFTKKYEKYLYTAAILGCSFALVLAAWCGLMTFLIVVLPFVLGILYSIPCLPPSTGYRRLKEIPLLKNLIVAIAWGVPLTFISLFITNTSVTLATVISLIFLCSFVFIASVLPDIRDTEGDKIAGIRTIPVIIGAQRTIIVITGVNLIVGISAVIISAIYLAPAAALVLAVSTLYTHISIQSFARIEKKDIICDIMTDGQFIFIGILAFSISLLSGSLAIPG